MAIVPLLKMTLYGAETQKAEVISGLHDLACLHLLNLASAGNACAEQLPSDAHEALKYLQACSQQLRHKLRPHGFDRKQVVQDALALQQRETLLCDERDELLKAIDDLEPWGEFELPAEGTIGGVHFWFYVVPLGEFKHVANLTLPWREISRDYQSMRILVLSVEQPQEVPGRLVQLDRRPLSQLRARVEDINDELEETHHRRVGLTRWSGQLTSALDEADDANAQCQAAGKTLDASKVFALQAWLPEPELDRMREFAREHGLALSVEPPSIDDEPPTLLQHPESVAGSEALVTFYKTPAYRSWDPSVITYISFAVFFAMILADAGYGLVLSLITAYLWSRMGSTQAGRRGRNVLFTIVAFTFVYGILCGSYFGFTPPANSILGRLKLIDAQSQALMMPLTILVGVVHLSLAHVVMAWLNRGRSTALASLGWIAVMLGATLAGIAMFEELSEALAHKLTEVGTVSMVSGLGAVFLFSSNRPLFSLRWKDHAWRVVDGLQGLTGVSGLFGDVLSYLRLFALGLSSAKLSETFNNLGASAWDTAGFGVIAAIAIIILGHTLNLLLSIMSGVVHGLRLNCIEFFKYGLPEEGYLFQSFAKKARPS